MCSAENGEDGNRLTEYPFVQVLHPAYWKPYSDKRQRPASNYYCFSCFEPCNNQVLDDSNSEGGTANEDVGPLFCQTCELAWYCSEKCRNVDLHVTYQHKWECKVFCQVKEMNLLQELVHSDLRLIGRVLSKLQAPDPYERDSGFPKDDINRRAWDDLMSHFDHWDSHELTEKLWKWFQKYYLPIESSPFEMIERNQFVEIFGKIQTNTFEHLSPTESLIDPIRNLGLGIYLQISRFDHACKSDLVRYFDGAKLVLKPRDQTKTVLTQLTPVELNDLKITYIYRNETIAPTAERQENLLSTFLFLCQCDKCTNVNEDLLDWSASAYQCAKCDQPLVPDTHGENSMVNPATNPSVCLQNRDDEIPLDLVCLDCALPATQINLMEYCRAMRRAMEIANPASNYPPQSQAANICIGLSELNALEGALHPQKNAWLFLARKTIFQTYLTQIVCNNEGQLIESTENSALVTIGPLIRKLEANFTHFCPDADRGSALRRLLLKLSLQ